MFISPFLPPRNAYFALSMICSLIKVSSLSVGDPGMATRSSHFHDLRMVDPTLAATLSDAWHYCVSAVTDLPSVNIMLDSKIDLHSHLSVGVLSKSVPEKDGACRLDGTHQRKKQTVMLSS